MAEAFEGADVVYPKSWAPYQVMERRTELLKKQDAKGLEALEKECLENNRRFADWQCTESLMARTRDALYLHCLPADISGVSCERGEVEASVFERFRAATYRQAGYKPYITAAILALGKLEDPVGTLHKLLRTAPRRAP
jgi:ornithine carbamoyltransferase